MAINSQPKELSLSDLLWEAPDADYLQVRRQEHRTVAKGVGAIAIISLTGYLGFGGLFPQLLQLSSLVMAAIGMMAALLVYIFVVGLAAYERYEFIDIAPFLLVGVAQFGVNATFFPGAATFGASEVNVVTFNAAVLTAAGSIIVVGSFRSFLVILAIYSALVLAFAFHSARSVWHMTQAAPFATIIAAAMYINAKGEQVSRTSFARFKKVEEQGVKIRELLENVLPEDVVERLNNNEIVADS